MISFEDFYKVMCAMVPLYVAMFLAYGSVKWWKIFSPEQCSGINRFVAVFAVPVLSFHFIAQNNPYQMNPKFILADTFSKVIVLFFLFLWMKISQKGSLDWLITIFSVSTLPNTLVMGIPLLRAMYGDFTETLMVQLVVLQCIIWYTLLLFLFEYRAATLLIMNQFPIGAASITKFEVDADVVSLDGRDPLRTETEVTGEGQIVVKIRRSTSTLSFAGDSTLSSGKTHGLPPSMPSSIGITPRPSNLSNVEIYSVHSSKPNTPVVEIFSGYASSDAYSLQPTPRTSNFNEGEAAWVRGLPSPVSGMPYGQAFRQPGKYSPAFSLGGEGKPTRVVEEERREFGGLLVWGSPAAGENCRGIVPSGVDMAEKEKDLSFRCKSEFPTTEEENTKLNIVTNLEMPRPFVMLRLIMVMVGRKLARNHNTYSSVLGLMWSLISFRWDVGMPSIVKYSIKIISNAGLGMAMFSLGLFMALQPRIIGCGLRMAAITMAIRFVGGPILMSVSSIVVGLRGIRLHAAIVQAALPQGIVPFVFAREYVLHPDILSTGVIFGMLVSLPVTLLYYIFLGL